MAGEPTELSEVVVVAAYKGKRGIQGLSGQLVIREKSTDDLTITEHPVEQGAQISDHAYKEPAEVTLEYGWSNSSISGALGAVGGLISGGDPNYVRATYAKLLALQASRKPFHVVTGKRTYKNMLAKSVGIVTDADTESALLATITCREVIIVETQSTAVPPRDVQANPAATASPTDTGTKLAAPAPTANVSALARIAGVSP